MMGDFNVTEDAIDRAPPRLDDTNAKAALQETKQRWKLIDEWRNTHPNETSFTYRANTNGGPILSRLDRIYVAKARTPNVFNWNMAPTPVPTDHWIVSVKYAPKDAPHIGKGRWTWYLPSLQNRTLVDAVIERGIKLQSNFKMLRTGNTTRELSNLQLLWKEFKANIKQLA
jgi:hypothetical protein